MPTYLTDLENEIYVASHLQNDIDTPSEDMIVGFSCFSPACKVFWLLRYFCKIT